MYNPSHPGEILREEVIDALGLSVTEAARRLGMSRVALSRVLNGKAGISPDLAIRLERAGVATARAWLQMQATPLPPLLRVLNKIDLDGTPSGPCADEGETPCIALSARTGAGLDALRAALRERAGGDAAEAGGAFSARERHVQALLRTQQELLAAQAEVVASGRGGLAELAAEALRRAQSALDELTGVHSSEDLLGSIFGSFCIGK